jgi:hypothetical protein
MRNKTLLTALAAVTLLSGATLGNPAKAMMFARPVSVPTTDTGVVQKSQYYGGYYRPYYGYPYGYYRPYYRHYYPYGGYYQPYGYYRPYGWYRRWYW